jgi:thiol:disulfide interchange protein DsbD
MAPHLFFIRSLFLFAGLCTSAWAQFGALVTQSTVSTPQVRAELVAYAPDGVRAGTTFWIGLQLQHAPEWHTYWRNPGDAGLPTELSFTLPKGFELGPVLWPLPEKIAVGRYTNYGFHKDVLLAVAVTVAPTYRAPGHRQVLVQLRANWLACRLECLRQEGQFVLKLPTQGSFVAHKNAFDWLLSQQPTQRLTPQRPAKFEDTVLVSTLQGLPPEWAGKKLSVFPLNPELLESSTDQHPKASQEWQGEVLSVRLPASTTRTESPQDISLLLVSGEGLLRQGVEVSVPVAGVWPASSAQAFPRPEGTQSRAPKAAVSSGSWIFSLTLVSALLGGLILNAALRVWLGPLRTPRARGVQIACLACLCWIGMSLFSILNTL